MFHYNLKLIYRTFKRYKGYFFLNLAGLSLGMACAIMIYMWVNDELHVDKFNEKDSRLFQVMKTSPNAEGGADVYETTPGLLAQTMKEELPEVEYAASVIPHRNQKGIISAVGKRLKALPMYVDKDYFHIFSYRLLQGNKDQALSDKNGVLLSDKLAQKLFGSAEKSLIGKTVQWESGNELSGPYTIAGIFEAPLVGASDQFDLLFTYQLYFDMSRDRSNLTFWNSNNPSTFLVLKAGTNLRQFNDKIRDFAREKYKAFHGTDGLEWIGELFLQRYSDKYLHNQYENGRQSGGRIEYVRLFSMIAIFILVIACINFMNLSTAKASRKLREIGIKKTIGANRKTLVVQYLGESLLMTFLSLLIALLLVALLLDPFNEITGKQLAFHFNARLVSALIAITLFTGLIAGSYPATYLSGFRPLAALKGGLNTAAGELWTRKGLVVFQFVISVVLIVTVVVVYKQIAFIQNKNLGYDKDNVILFSNEGNLRHGLQTFLSEARNIPGVINASSMDGDLTGEHSGGGGIDWEGKTRGVEFGGLDVDFNFIETMGLEVTEGRPFSREFGSDSNAVLFNESAIAAMGLKDPVGKTATLWGNEKQIIGVIKDFHFESLYKKVGPFFLRYAPDNSNVLVKIKAGTEKETLARLEKFYREYNKGLPFEYEFLDADYQALYTSERRVAALSRYFAVVAIIISCLGLFGLAAFTAEKRQKEIGIRKVLGASVSGVVALLSKDFIRLVLVAIMIALPLSWHLMKGWLENFAYGINLKWWMFAVAGAAAVLVALTAVGFQSVKAALMNPVKALRSE